LSELSTVICLRLVLLNLDDVANCVAAGVDVGEPAGIFQIFGAFPFMSATNKFPFESIATPVLPGCAGAVGICANGDATKGADVGNNVGASDAAAGTSSTSTSNNNPRTVVIATVCMSNSFIYNSRLTPD
jgi:hypothetical protein